MPMAERASIVVATYNRNEMLVDALNDLIAQDYPDFEVLVVDQSAEHTAEVKQFLEEFDRLPNGRWIRSDVPGLTRARNRGLQDVRGEYVIYVDDDVRIPDPHFVAFHVAALRRAQVGAVAGRVLEPNRAPLMVPRRVGWLGYLGTREPGFGSEASGWAETVRGCNMSFRRSVLEAIGGFDESYTKSAFREDTDIALRVRHSGYRIWFASEAWLYHLSSPTGGTRDQSIPVAEDLILNDVRFARKNLPPLQRALWLTRLYGSRVVKAGMMSGALVERHQAFRQALSQTRGERRHGS